MKCRRWCKVEHSGTQWNTMGRNLLNFYVIIYTLLLLSCNDSKKVQRLMDDVVF